MTRHFYDCPLNAGYMTKNFGMRFVSSHSGKEFDPSVVLANAGSPVDSIREGQRYFVHPDSLHQLEPRVGDLDENGFVWDGVKWQCQFLLLESRDSRTARRDGKPFFTPESTPE